MLANLNAALWAEQLKARRARMPLLTLAGLTLAPLMGALFMKILLDPALPAHFGALTTKAQFSAAHGDWPTYFGLLTQALAVGGAIIFSLVVIWLFGREYSDHTAKDLLALPTPRATIVTAKLLLAAFWCAILALWVYLLGLALGALIGLPGWTTDGWLHATAVYVVTATLTIALALPLAVAGSACAAQRRGWSTGAKPWRRNLSAGHCDGRCWNRWRRRVVARCRPDVTAL